MTAASIRSSKTDDGAQQIKPPAGHLVLYPATSLHTVTPISRGVRVASFFWLQDKITSIFNANWNRSASRAINFFTNVDDIASQLQIYGPPPIGCTGSVCTPPLNSSPFDNGLPDVVLSNLTGLSEQQPNLSIAQTISLSETLSWIYGKHNMRFGERLSPRASRFSGRFEYHRDFLFHGGFYRLRWAIFCWASRRRPASTPQFRKATCAIM